MDENSRSSSHESLAAIVDRLAQRLRDGEKLTVEDCLAEHSAYADEIRRIFPALFELERAISTSGGAAPADATAAFETPRDAPPDKVAEPVAGDFGDYLLLERIARGGMGAVYKARQKSLDRVVALKVVLDDRCDDSAAEVRFEAEARAAARLDHPGIVPIHEFGRHDGRRFLAMGYVDGETLAAKVAGGPLAAREAAEIVQRIAEAMEYAHSQGVAHRDLKPQNVLLGADGAPKIADFGLAKDLLQSQELTTTGQILGTPSYMAPEQAAAGESGKAADIYALGAILYCLVTGRPPFQGATIVETLRQVREDPPAPPRLLNSSIPLDLQTICLKCLEKTPARRYATAGEVAADLAMFLAGDRVSARAPSAAYVTQVWLRKHLRTVLAPMIVGLVFGASFGFSSLGLSDRMSIERVSEIYSAESSLGAPAFPLNLLIGIHGNPGLAALLGWIALGLIFVGLPSLGLVVRFFARPSDLQSDAAAGSLAGFVAGAAAIVFGNGWTSYYGAAIEPLLRAADELRVLPADAAVPGVDASLPGRAADALEQLAASHPEFGETPPETRAQVFVQRSALEGGAIAFWRTVRTMLILMFGFPAVTALQTVVLGLLERRAQTLFSLHAVHPRVREIVERQAPVEKSWGKLVGGPYYLVSYISTALVLFPLFWSGMVDPRIASFPSALVNGGLVLAFPLAIAIAANVLTRTLSARRVYHAHLALLEEHADKLGDGNAKEGWFPVVATLPEHEAGVKFGDGVAVGLLLCGQNEVRFVGRTLTGCAVDRRFAPDSASVQARFAWRKRSPNAWLRDNKRPHPAPGWLLFTIEDRRQRWSQFAFYGLPLLTFDRLSDVVVKLAPPLDRAFDDRVNVDDLPLEDDLPQVTGRLFAAGAPASPREIYQSGRRGVRSIVQKSGDLLTADAYRAVRNILPLAEPANLPHEPGDEVTAATAAAMHSPTDDEARRISPKVAGAMRALRAAPFVILAATIVGCVGTVVVGAMLQEKRDRNALLPFVLLRDGDRWTRIDAPSGWRVANAKNPKDRHWAVVDPIGKAQITISKSAYFVQRWDNVSRSWRTIDYETFMRETALRGQRVAVRETDRGKVAEVVGEVRDSSWLTDGDGERDYVATRELRYFGSLDEEPLAVACDVRAADFEKLAPIVWAMVRSAQHRTKDQLSVVEQRQLAAAEPKKPLAAIRSAGFVGAAGAATCVSSFIAIVFVQVLLIAGGKLFLEPSDAKRREKQRLAATRRQGELDKLGFQPAGVYALETFERPMVSLWTHEDSEAICYRYDTSTGEAWFFLSRFDRGLSLKTCDNTAHNTSKQSPGVYAQSFDKFDLSFLWSKHLAAYRFLAEAGATPLSLADRSPRDVLAELHSEYARYLRRRPWWILLSVFVEVYRWLRIPNLSVEEQVKRGLLPPPTRHDFKSPHFKSPR